MDSVFIPVIIVAIILLLFAFAVILNHEIYQYMLKASPTLVALAKLNAAFSSQLAGSRGQVYNIYIKAKSKAQFDAHTIEHACSLYLLGHYKAYKPICEQYKRDEATYRNYMALYQHLAGKLPKNVSDGKSGISQRVFRWLEVKIFEKQMVKPPSFRVDVLRTYDSPKRRNHYSDHTSYSPAAFIGVCEKVFGKIELREKAKKQRELLTPTLRYQVLIRDNLTCKLCGRSVEDGVILHVDHIKPVSKGGETTMENLRTLCADCNLGKGAIYNPDGMN